MYADITIQTNTGLAYLPDDFMQLSYDANNYIIGRVVSYDTVTGIMVFTPIDFAGAGTYSAWILNLTGQPAVQNANNSGIVCSIVNGQVIDTNEKIGYNSVFYNYSVYDCSNYVAGTLIAVWNPQSNAVEFSNTTTSSIGNTDGVSFAFQSIGNAINLIMYTPDNTWKYSFKKISLDDCCSVPYISGAFILTQNGSDLITESGDFLITS